jgi:hypothetical protein
MARIIRTKAAQARGAAKHEVERRTSGTTLSHRKEVIEEKSTEEDLGEAYFPPGVEPAFVRVGVGQTFNLGNFESLRIDVAVTLPTRVEDIDETYTRASEYVADKMAEEESLWFSSIRTPQKAGKKK